MNDLVITANYSDGTGILEPHCHDCHQIVYVDRGNASFMINSVRYDVKAPCVVIISRFEEHSIIECDNSYSRYVLRILPTLDGVDDYNAKLLFSVLVNRPRSFSHVIPAGGNAEIIEETMRRICEEKASGRKYSDKMLGLLMQMLLLSVCRAEPRLLLQEDGGDFDMIFSIKQKFETDYKKKYSLCEIADEYHISCSRLSHLFREVTGRPVMGYLMSCRIAGAKHMLAETEMPVGTVADNCGFSDFSNFSRTFRSVTGQSPSDFRIKNAPKNDQTAE